MASHHHYHHHGGGHHHHQATACCPTSPCVSCCDPLPQTEPLLQAALASFLLQQQNLHLSPGQTHLGRSCKDHNFRHQKIRLYGQEEHLQETHYVLSSLLSRIEALELSLQRFSPSHPCCSLREAAARVIQTHFRAFLVRRSRTLRQLKDLAFIKSRFTSLKLSISNKSHFDLEAVYRKAMDLLLKLDSIEGGDPMIRDGKRSITRDLVQLLDYIDLLAAKGHNVVYKRANSVTLLGNSNKSRVMETNIKVFGGDRRATKEKLSDRIERIRRSCKLSRNDDDDDVELEGFHQVIDEVESPRISVRGKNGVFVAQNRNGVLLKKQGLQGQPRVKKSVSFAENGNIYQVFSSGTGNVVSTNSIPVDDSVSSDDHEEIMENLCKEVRELSGVTENDEEAQLESGESSQSSDEEKQIRRNINTQNRSEIGRDHQICDESYVFSAPLPLKMESKGVKISR